jgi:hypothetical protein
LFAVSLVADFFKGTADTLLEKLVKPAGLLPAAVFVLLNLAFVYPTARDEQLAWATNFKNLSGGWQAATIAGLTLALGLVLQGASVGVMMVLEGTAWQDTPLGEWLTKRQIKKLANERDALRHAKDDRQRADRAWQIERRFGVEADPAPDAEPDDIAPTLLGNALKALQHTIYERYGIDLVPLLGHMHGTAAVKDSPALAAVDDEREGLELFANLAAVLSLFALECLAFYGKRGHWGSALLGALALPAAYGAYQVAVAKARAWSDAVGALFDLHRDDLRAQLKLRDADDADDDHELWEKASRFLRPPGEPIAAELFDEEPIAPTAVVTVEGDLEVSLVQATPIEPRGGAIGESTPLTCISYRILVARTQKAAYVADSEILVTDPRVGIIDTPPTPLHDVRAEAAVIDDGASASLCWRFERLRRGDSLLLAYTLPIWVLAVDSQGADAGKAAAPATVTFSRLQEGHRFRIKCDPFRKGVAYTITARYLGDGDFAPPVLSTGGTPVEGRRFERGLDWSGISFGPGDGVVTIDLGTTEGTA